MRGRTPGKRMAGVRLVTREGDIPGAGALVLRNLFRLIDSFKAFPLIYVLTNGGPGNVTEVTNYYGFIQAFNFSYWGYASAIAVMLTVGVFVLSWLISTLAAGSPTHD